MLEIEAKVRVKSLDPMARMLRRTGATFLYTVREEDRYFDCPAQKLFKSNSGLRLRKQTHIKPTGQAKYFLTWKGPAGKSAFKSRREIQVQVSDFTATRKLLTELGYQSTLTVRKTRQLWKSGKCVICLDQVPGLGTFIEVEGPGEKHITAILNQLGLDKKNHIPNGYASMLANKTR